MLHPSNEIIHILSTRCLLVPHMLKKHLSGKKNKGEVKESLIFFKDSFSSRNLNPYKQKDEWPGFQLQWWQAAQTLLGVDKFIVFILKLCKFRLISVIFLKTNGMLNITPTYHSFIMPARCISYYINTRKGRKKNNRKWKFPKPRCGWRAIGSQVFFCKVSKRKPRKEKSSSTF